MRSRIFFLIIIACFTTVGNEVHSQEDTIGYAVQLELFKNVDAKVKTLDDLVLYSELLKTNSITISKIKAMVYMARAQKHWDLLYSEMFFTPNDEDEQHEIQLEQIKPELLEILSDYTIAIEMCSECSLEYQYFRFVFLDELTSMLESEELDDIHFTAVFESDYSVMKSFGYKDDRMGFGVGINGIHGKENWIGIEFSLISAYEPINRLKYRSAVDNTLKRYWINSYPVNGSWLTFGYNYSLTSGSHDFNFDLMSITSPVHLNLFKFGTQKTIHSNNLLAYYRPEIGLGFGCFSVYYAYNAVFKKSMRNLLETHMIGVKIKLIPFKNSSIFE